MIIKYNYDHRPTLQVDHVVDWLCNIKSHMRRNNKGKMLPQNYILLLKKKSTFKGKLNVKIIAVKTLNIF